MMELIRMPLFGILLSIAAFEIGIFIQKKTRVSLLNPLLIAVLGIMGLLALTGIPYEAYNQGGQYIHFMLGPATVILAVPLYRQLDLLKRNLVPILGGITVGCVTAITSVIVLSRLFDLEESISISMIPKSVTTPIGIEVSRQIGGIPSVTVALIVVTGIFGAVAGPTVCRLFRVKEPMAVGTALGTASHALGTTKAMELGETQGAMSSLSIGVAGLITVFLAPLLMGLLM